MSAIFGYLLFDGQPTSPDNRVRMKKAMTRWGPDGLTTITEGSAMMGFANLAITPESIHDALPVSDQQSGILFTAAARLDNRDELSDLFGIIAAERPTLPDSHLVLHAWRKWGTDAPAHLFGDWSFAAWDSRQRSLFLARDQLGNTGVYYYCQPPFFAFSSSLQALLTLDFLDKQINEEKLASYLTLIPMGKANETYWKGIHRLPGGFCLTATSHGHKTQQYWDISAIPTVSGMKDEEYVSGFLYHYRKAVDPNPQTSFG